MSKKDDIKIVCETILNNWEDYNAQSRYRCNYCTGHYSSSKDYPTKLVNGYHHSLDCPVLVAQDLLTNSD